MRDVVQRISAPIDPANIHLASPIVSLILNETGNEATIDIHCTSNRTYTGFSHIILATQANHARPLLQDYLDTLPRAVEQDSSALRRHREAVRDQVDCLSHFEYCKTTVVNHTDPTLVPDAPEDRRDLNLIMASPSLVASAWKDGTDDRPLCVPPTYAMATHVLPALPGVYQTTNPIIPPREDTVLSVAKLERAVVSVRGKAALAGLWRERKECEWKWGCAGDDGGVLGPLQGAGRLDDAKAGNIEKKRMPGIWLCGSYAHCGIPLLEGCVVSGRNVAEQGVWASEGVDLSTVSSLC